MIFSKKGSGPALPNELNIAAAEPLLRSASEFLRMWHQPGGKAVCLIDPTALSPDPASFGIALADCARHGARAWAHATGVSEEEALARIWFGVDAERNDPTDLGKEVN